MNKQNLQNKKLDQIGRNLLESVRIRGDEIDKIVATPQLFNSVRAKIKAEQTQRERKNFSVNHPSFIIWNWQNIGLAFGVLAILFGAMSLSFLVKQNLKVSPLVVSEIINPQIELLIAPAEIQPLTQIVENIPKFAKRQNAVANNRTKVQIINSKRKTLELRENTLKTKFVKHQANPEKENEEPFYTLTSAGNSIDNNEDFRIIRADLTRSQLFALGLNLTLDNENERIKTDLLVGSDNFPKAIRFVKLH
jgi:hypothetical protein